MNKRILLGVNTELSPAAQYALQTLGQLFDPASQSVSLILLTVIPNPSVSALHAGLYTGQFETITSSSWQYQQAEKTLRTARLLLQEDVRSLFSTECVVRVGIPAEEIAQAARELCASLIVLGCHDSSPLRRVRHFLEGNLLYRVSQLAPCPVVFVAPPQPAAMQELLTWYTDAVTRYLREHAGTLMILTPSKVAGQFLPPHKKTPGHKEIQAATRALDELARTGHLCRYDVEGERRYFND